MANKSILTRVANLFDADLTKDDGERLGPHLTNYNRLNELLVLNGIPVKDIQKLILLELEGKNRSFILRKLVGRLKSKERTHLLNLISSCVKVPSKPRSSTTPKAKAVSRTSSPARRNAVSPTA